VIKIGGSVLTDAGAYRRAARHLADRVYHRPDEKILAIVSAQYGDTDRLLAAAQDMVGEPRTETLDLLWSTGELRSAALLTLALQGLGVSAVAANVHQTGIRVDSDRHSIALTSQLRIRSLLARADVVVAPGFLATTPGDGIASLGRGGSDLSAVLLAARLSAPACELLKDVPGYFDRDPNLSHTASPIDALGYDDAIAMAQEGCELVQLRALEAARDLGVTLIVRSFDGGRRTVVGPAFGLATARQAGDHGPSTEGIVRSAGL
jgi:aspartate kinase